MMRFKTLRLLVSMIVLFTGIESNASTVDSLDVPSKVMNKAYKAAVVLPASYAKNQASYPVLYLLHGAGGQFSNWLSKTPDKNLVKNLADRYNIIIVIARR